MKIACITYRNWALEIYSKLVKKYSNQHQFYIVKSKEEFSSRKIKEFEPDLILWYGWSWLVDSYFTKNYISVMLHPSPLPKYRGGSPIQNQIINGEKNSAVTLFKMNDGLDEGDIFYQSNFSLQGCLDEIFLKIIKIGFLGSCKIIDNEYTLVKQNHKNATYFKRRKPQDSEITIQEIKESSAEYLYNKIRMLNDPYPNAYIKTADNKKLYIIKSKLK